mmetsp:Transcript_35999/g.42066  ORF Transcript_35999/g.42066 Transcript_35999/m.42066 type:complete len:498 (-) Transcript_35999:129-1622(-)
MEAAFEHSPALHSSGLVEAIGDSVGSNRVKASFHTKKQASIITIFNITNTMIGTGMLVIPLQFLQAGVIPSLLAVLIIGWVNYKTCNLCIIHRLSHEGDLSDVLERMMGKNWRKVFLWSSVLLLYLASVAYFLLMLDPFYTILNSFFELPPSDEITLAEFSHTWATIILITFCFCLFSIKNLSFILKFNSVGIIALVIFVIFVLVTGVQALIMGKVGFTWEAEEGTKFPLMSFDVVTISGIFALAFLIHNLIIQIMRYNKNAHNNTRDLAIGYTVVGLIYSALGIFGGMAVSWRPNCNAIDFKNQKSKTIMDCYTKDEPFSFYFMIVASTFVLLHLSTVIPMIVFIVRNQVLELAFGPGNKTPAWAFWLYNIVQTLCMLLAGVLDLFPSTILAIDGAVCGFGLLYVIPICLHWKACSKPEQGAERLTDSEDIVTSNMSENHNAGGGEEEAIDLAASYKAAPIRQTKALYGSLFAFGALLLVLQLYQTVVGIVHSFEK